MSFAGLREKMKHFDRNAEVIFDREEPVGATTDMVMPRRRWLRRKPQQPNRAVTTKASV